MNSIRIKRLFAFRLIRFCISAFILARSGYYALTKNIFSQFIDYCWLARVSDVTPFDGIGKYLANRQLDKIIRYGQNHLIPAFRKSKLTQTYIQKYSISGRGKQDIFRDVIVLKSPSDNELGVILLKYAITFEAFILFFDVEKVLEKYIIVLEPCWSGYYNTNILMWLLPNYPNRIYVQCYTEDDYEHISALQPYFRPVELGPADWVDSNKFKPDEYVNKIYDLIMVANWSIIKKHRILFNALNKIDDRQIRILLIGFPWGGRTAEDIRRELKTVQQKNIEVEIKENVSHAEVVECLNRSKVYIFLSEKEGDNKALVEAMCSNLPAIVYENTIGGARRRINKATGAFSSYKSLDQTILYMLDNYHKFNPRQWALSNTGSTISTHKLNSIIKATELSAGRKYEFDIVEKINAPNLAYKNPQHLIKFEHDYLLLKQCQRSI